VDWDTKKGCLQRRLVRVLLTYFCLCRDPNLQEKVVAVLANLTTIGEGRLAITEAWGIKALVAVTERGTPRSKENAAAALLQLCINSSRLG
jgi:hypothetical protein